MGEPEPDGGAPVAIRVLISEVVTAPVNDWNHSDSSGRPFDGTVGGDPAGTDDEYIEIYNAGPEPADLSGWTLAIIDDSPVEGLLGAVGLFVPGAGSRLDALQPGAYAVIGNPQGTMSNDVFIVMRDQDGRIVDDVEIGGLTPSFDMEGDGVGDGAPSADGNGFARGTFDEAVARSQAQDDTDIDQADFAKAYATPLGPNKPPTRPTETQPPRIVSAPSETRTYAVSELLQVSFDEPLAGASVMGNLVLTAGGEDLPLGHYRLEDGDSTLIVNPVGRLPHDATVVLTLRGGAGGITDLAGNPIPEDVTFRVTTEPAAPSPGAIVINELCLSPRQDWSDSSGGDGVPFSSSPGTGAVNSQDEWMELLVNADGPIDMRDYSIVIYNGPNLFTPSRVDAPLSSSTVIIRVVGSGTIDAARTGDRIVVGNPRGAFLHDTYIELRDGAGALVDSVEIGGNSRDTDRGGDGIMNGAPGPGQDGRSTHLGDETIARVPDGLDTGDDSGDFAYATASPGEDNQAVPPDDD